MFNVIIMAKTTSRLGFGLEFGDRFPSDAEFADDLALMAESMDQLVEALHILQKEAAKLGLQVNWEKTKIMVVDPSSSIASPPVALDQTTTFDVVQQFTY